MLDCMPYLPIYSFDYVGLYGKPIHLLFRLFVAYADLCGIPTHLYFRLLVAHVGLHGICNLLPFRLNVACMACLPIYILGLHVG